MLLIHNNSNSRQSLSADCLKVHPSTSKTMVSKIVVLVLFAVLIPNISAVFTDDFKEFLIESYGKKGAAKLARLDLGPGRLGSFGGKESENDTITKQPIIFVHGLTQRAGFWIQNLGFFKEKGYTSAELYATSYGDGGVEFVVKSQSNCENVKQVRRFIEAVHKYTNSKVDIIGHSLGGAMSRKAILGGKCVDTNEDLGGPLTAMVDTYISLAGVAYGSERCPYLFLANCNKNNGFDCRSEFIHDINEPNVRYQGDYSYYIWSHDDHIIGDDCCGHLCPEVKNATDFSENYGYNHFSIVPKTLDIQYSMLTDHVVIKKDSNKLSVLKKLL